MGDMTAPTTPKRIKNQGWELFILGLSIFSIVNVVAGASKLSLRDFILGTALGMAPGIAVMAALGAQIADLARNASWTNALLLALAILAWIALCLCVQFLVTWWTGRRT